MNREKDSSALTCLINMIKISGILLICIVFLYVVFSKPLKEFKFTLEAGKVNIETSCEFYEDELRISQ